eukprot:13620521-Alexandrium_andersonii.AAC.1
MPSRVAHLSRQRAKLVDQLLNDLRSHWAIGAHVKVDGCRDLSGPGAHLLQQPREAVERAL